MDGKVNDSPAPRGTRRAIPLRAGLRGEAYIKITPVPMVKRHSLKAEQWVLYEAIQPYCFIDWWLSILEPKFPAKGSGIPCQTFFALAASTNEKLWEVGGQLKGGKP